MDRRDHVRRYEDADALSVFKYREPMEGQPPAFLQCGGFVYPLVKGTSPVLKTGERTYMFPELRGEGRRTCFWCITYHNYSEKFSLSYIFVIRP